MSALANLTFVFIFCVKISAFACGFGLILVESVLFIKII